MKWFFTSKESQKILHRELREWIGTPFRHYAGVKKAGADCIHFALTVYVNVGAVLDALHYIPRYSHDWCHHTSEQMLYKGLRAHKLFVEVGHKEPMNGDILLYQFGRAASHCGIYHDGSVYQSIERIGVCRLYHKDPSWIGRLRFGFRVKNG